MKQKSNDLLNTGRSMPFFFSSSCQWILEDPTGDGCIRLLRELAHQQRILYYDVSLVRNRQCCDKMPGCRQYKKGFNGTFCFLAKARCLSFSASRLSRFLRHFSSSGGISLFTMSVSSTTKRTARSGNKPAVDRYRTSASVRGKPSRIKPVDLK